MRSEAGDTRSSGARASHDSERVHLTLGRAEHLTNASVFYLSRPKGVIFAIRRSGTTNDAIYRKAVCTPPRGGQNLLCVTSSKAWGTSCRDMSPLGDVR